tara:strand:+ start:7522 stop:7791 length:270 start_codon:yes stop_codon:yes gene_type:complete
MNENHNIFFYKKAHLVLLTILNFGEPICTTIISRKIGTTFSHTIILVKKMEDMKLLKKKEDGGRVKEIVLTKKGVRVARQIRNLMEMLR